MLENIKEDLNFQTKHGSISQKIKIIIFNHSFHLLVLVRLGCWFRATVPIVGFALGFLAEYLIRIIYASDISCRAKIGPGLNIIHGHDIVIGSEVSIGEHCKIFNGVTLGNKDTESEINLQPIIGRNVVLGTGAKILGGVLIGDNVKIGANSVVITNVPANSVFAGVPAKLIKTLPNQT